MKVMVSPGAKTLPSAGDVISSVGGAFTTMVVRACAVFPQSALLATLLGHALRRAGRHQESHHHLARALRLQRTAQTYRAEFPKEDGTVHFWQFGAHILGLPGQDAPPAQADL